jgi:hypothetical protein
VTRSGVELYEFFYLFNTPQFGLPGVALGGATCGVVSSQANAPRQVQAGMKLVFSPPINTDARRSTFPTGE